MRKAMLVGLLAGSAFGVFGEWVEGLSDGIDLVLIASLCIGGVLAGTAWRTTRASPGSTVFTFYGGWVLSGILFVLPLVAAEGYPT